MSHPVGAVEKGRAAGPRRVSQGMLKWESGQYGEPTRSSPAHTSELRALPIMFSLLTRSMRPPPGYKAGMRFKVDEEQKPEITAACHCGMISLRLACAPTEVTECTCSICRRYGVLWSYHRVNEVQISGGPTDWYTWKDGSIAFHRCARCGCVTHWLPVSRSENRMGVNARLLDLNVLRNARVRHLDGAVTEKYLD